LFAGQRKNTLFESNAQHRSIPEESGHRTMNEDDLARRIVARLDRGLADLPPAVVERLADVRRRALRIRPVRASSFARLRAWTTGHRFVIRIALPALFVLVAAGTVLYLQTVVTPDPLDVETALLADELPIHAYTDPGFDAWLSHTSHERQQ
jgi:hypothetical protein